MFQANFYLNIDSSLYTFNTDIINAVKLIYGTLKLHLNLPVITLSQDICL